MQEHLSMLLFFCIPLYSKCVLRKGNPLLPRCLSQDAAPCTGLVHLSWAGSCPSTVPILEQTDRKQRRKLGFEGFFCSLPPPPPQHCMDVFLQKPKHLPCSTRFCWGWDELQGDSDGGSVCKCMVACVHECSLAWVWCAPGCLLSVLGGKEDTVGLGCVCFQKMVGSRSCDLSLGMDDFLGNS